MQHIFIQIWVCTRIIKNMHANIWGNLVGDVDLSENNNNLGSLEKCKWSIS